MLSNYFVKKQVFGCTSEEIWRIQIQIYPRTSIEPRYGAFYLTNKVSAHGLGLLVQLSWRVAPPWWRNQLYEKTFMNRSQLSGKSYKQRQSGQLDEQGQSAQPWLSGPTGKTRAIRLLRNRAIRSSWLLWQSGPSKIRHRDFCLSVCHARATPPKNLKRVGLDSSGQIESS